MKKLILFSFFLFTLPLAYSQSLCCVVIPRINCDTLNKEGNRQLCWLKLFAKNKLNIDGKTFGSYLKYNKGKKVNLLQNENAPWGGNDMEYRYGGIARRWQDTVTVSPLSDTSELSWAEANRMHEDMLALLSPAEKLDIYLGNDDYRITKFEMTNRGVHAKSNTVNDGFCNGMRAAGALLPEPIRPITVHSKFQVPIVFQPADLKALAAASYFHLYDDTCYAQIGCPRSQAEECALSPVAFDIGLRMVLGDLNRAFFLDPIPGQFLANQTIYGYKRNIAIASSVSTGRNAVKTINVQTDIYVLKNMPLKESNQPTRSIISNPESKQDWLQTYRYNYILTVDKDNNIVSGKWQGKRPNFVWFAVGEGGDDHQPAGITNANRDLPSTVIKELVLKSASVR